MEISFPNLGIDLKYVPKGFTVFGFTIAIYGICIAIAVICGYLMAAKVAKKTGQNPDTYFDFAIYAVIFSIIGARIYYVIFQWDYYKNHPLSILNLREGGLAIYGGVIVAFITVFVYCKIKKLNPFRFMDTALPGLILGGGLGILMPPSQETARCRGETGLAQVRLELGAEVLGVTQQLFLETAPPPVDASAVLKHIIGMAEGENPEVSDLNGDNIVNALDAAIMLKRAVGL